MLSQNFQPESARNRRHKEIPHTKLIRNFALVYGIFVIILCLTFSACKTSPADLRNFAPHDTLIYLETKDLAETLNALTENETFKRLSDGKKDLSALENVQIAVFINGFEGSQKEVTESQSIINFKPRFVAVAETHLWNWQANSLAENQIGEFVKQSYGDETTLETSEKTGGRWFEWTAKDERKAFALVENSRIFFGNDQNSIEKALAVSRGESESFSKNAAFKRAYEANQKGLAFGYISAEGLVQIADIAGVSAASEASDDDAPRSFIAKVLPQIVKNSITEIIWTARKSETGIEDNFKISTAAEVSSVLKETIVPASGNQTNLAEFLPAEVFSVTRYNLQNPQIAWRSLLLTAAKQADALSARILIAFADTIFAPYGIAQSENFLSAVGSEIITARFDAEGTKSVSIVTVKNAETVKQSLTEEINFKNPPENQFGADIWKTSDGILSAAFTGDKLILGDAESVLKCLQAAQSGQNFTKTGRFSIFAESRAVAVTFSNDKSSAESIVRILGNPKNEQNTITNYLTETRFDGKVIERRTISDFGFIGTILDNMTE